MVTKPPPSSPRMTKLASKMRCTVVVLGDSRVGKSALIRRFVEGEFKEVSVDHNITWWGVMQLHAEFKACVRVSKQDCKSRRLCTCVEIGKRRKDKERER